MKFLYPSVFSGAIDLMGAVAVQDRDGNTNCVNHQLIKSQPCTSLKLICLLYYFRNLCEVMGGKFICRHR